MLEGGVKAQATHELGEEVLAAGELRQGKAPSMASMMSGAALFELLRPRRSKVLPRRFALAVTADRVVAIKALGVSSDEGDSYRVFLRGGECGSWPRSEVWLEAPEGVAGKGGTLHLGSERVPVFRPHIDGEDEETAELFGLLIR